MIIPAAITLDEAALDALIESKVRRFLTEMIREEAMSTLPNAKLPRVYLISSTHDEDILQVVEAPDTTAGERNEPHWKIVQDIRKGDIIIFRDSAARGIVGYAIADRTEKGTHRHAPEKKALRWWLTDAVRLSRRISDDDFRRLFERTDDGSAGFLLFRNTGQFSQKTYAYPLGSKTAKALGEAMGADFGRVI